MQNVTEKSLQELTAEFPDIWQEVIKSIKGHIEKRQMEKLSELATKANATLARWINAAGSPLAETDHARFELVKAHMTRLAIEQFVCAYTGVSTAITFKDRFLISSLLWLAAERGVVTTQKRFDFVWSMIANKTAAAAAVQKNGYWSIPTTEICSKIVNLANNEEILEIGSGRGLYLAGIRAAGGKVKGIDDYSWTGASKPLSAVKSLITKMGAKESLLEIRPKIVLSVWPTPQNNFESLIFQTNSVQTYICIVSKHQFASGNWHAYKDAGTSGKFSCTTLPDSNQLLRPIEMEQQFLIFRRKS
jgi:hypothetical protein